MGAEPARCVVIEDTPTGIEAGVAAGMRVLGYAGAAHANVDAMRAAGAQLFDRMASLPGLLEGH
jgi:beta-phosphoglucomutase-like phosphatase (HAD superfamily)